MFTFNVPNAPTLQTCQASSALATPGCSGSALGPGQVVWNSGTVAVEADASAGAVASLGWSPAATNGSNAPSVSGARLDPAGGLDVVVANPSGTAPTTGVVAFSLYAPTVSAIGPAAVVGSGPIYLVAAALAAASALGGIALYREREERLQREL